MQNKGKFLGRAEGIFVGRRSSDCRSIFASRRWWHGLFRARACAVRNIVHEARKIRTNFLFWQKELSQGDEIWTVGLSLQATVSGVVCFGLMRTQRALLRMKRAK